MTTAMVLNIAQARVLAKSSQPLDVVVSCCPNATYFLKDRGYHVVSTVDIYRAWSHARVVVLAERDTRRIVEAATQQYHLNALEAESLATLVHNFLCCTYHLHFCFRALRSGGGQFFWVRGKRLAGGDYDTMFTSLAGQVAPDILSYANTRYSAAHYLLASTYNVIVGFFVGRSRRLKVMDYGDELPKRVIRAMIECGEHPIAFHTRNVSKTMWKTTSFFIKSLRRLATTKDDGKPVYIFRAAWPRRYREVIAPFIVPDLFARAMHPAVQAMVALYLPFIRTELALGQRIVRRFQPDVAVSEHANYPHVLGGLAELHALGGKHAMINHGTHTVQHGAISRLATLSWGAKQHLITPYTTHALPKSPLTAALYPEIRNDTNYTLTRINVYGKVANQAAADGKFVILQAGNYTDAFHHVPWCKETADEYLLAILELVEEVGKLDNVELIIKLKNKKSATHQKIVEAHIAKLGISDKVRVDTTSRFPELMARTHLMVCNLSGTIEEALANHIPVMIHTYRKTYFHIDPQVVADSTADGLAPAYLVKQREDIGRIITRLSARCAGLHDPALFARVAWQENELTSMREFAKDLVNSTRRRW